MCDLRALCSGRPGKDESASVLIVGLGAAALALVRQLPAGSVATVVEPKDFIEFTPGCLRGFCDVEHWKSLVVSVQDALENACPSAAQASWLKGRVEVMRERSALVDTEQMSNISSSGSEPLPKALLEIPFDYAIVCTGSANGLWKPEAASSCNLALREAQMTAQRDRLAAAEKAALREEDNGGFPRVVIHGAGIVGVELAAEIVEYFPGLQSHVVLLSRGERILPSHPESVAVYAAQWCERNGVQIKCGDDCSSYQAWLESKQENVQSCVVSYFCVGGKPLLPKFEPPAAQDSKGYVVVNREMRIMGDVENPRVWADGRVFAFGDCAEVLGYEGQIPKIIYPAEGIASTVAHNLAASINHRDNGAKEVAPMLSPTIISLGSRDAVMDVSGHHIWSGYLSSFTKYMIEKSKMSQANGGVWGSILWRFVPHL